MIQESAIQEYILKAEIDLICITQLPQDERYPDPINDNQLKLKLQL